MNAELRGISELLEINYKSVKKLIERINSIAEIKFSLLLPIIGGDGIIVEMDESKFGKRKYHRGHLVGGGCMGFGMVERKIERKIVLIPIIKKIVKL